jgi:hypothetical protein
MGFSGYNVFTGDVLNGTCGGVIFYKLINLTVLRDQQVVLVVVTGI